MTDTARLRELAGKLKTDAAYTEERMSASVRLIGRDCAEASAAILSLLDELDASKARIAEGWQDIATAPKDGSDVLCYGVYYTQPVRFVAHWNGIEWYAGWGGAIQPKMWQPLPPPPHGDAK
jgi:hypothetical protein